MKRWITAAVIFVAGTTIGGLVVWSVAKDDGNGGTSNVAANKSGEKLSAPAEELLDRLDAGQKATYHVRYSYSGASGTSAVMEVWRKGGKVRRDLTVVSPSQGTAKTQEFLGDGKLVRCLLVGDHPWQCTSADVKDAKSLEDPLNGANRQVAGKTVTVTNDKIADHDVKCYGIESTAVSSKPSQFCLSAENVPLRIDGGDGKPVEATNYDLTVDDSVFAYPAPVAGLSSA